MPPEETKEEIKIEEPEINSTEKVDDATLLSDGQGFGEAKENNNSNTESSTEPVSIPDTEQVSEVTISEPVLTPEPTPEPALVSAPELNQNTESIEKSDGLKEYLSETKSYVSRLLDRANVALNTKRQKKLGRIIEFANKKVKIKNDDVEKLLHVSDATATRYLSKLVKDGKLHRISSSGGAYYEIVR